MGANITETNRSTEVGEDNDPKLQKFADEKDIVLLSFIGSYVPRRYGPTQFAGSTMSVVDEFNIEEALVNITSKRHGRGGKLYLLVNTLGGSVASSFKISMAIRRHFDDITVFVPHIAASGGTVLALAGNRIRMGMMSQLSPVDAQVPYKSGYISANSLLVAESDIEKRTSMKRPDELSYLEKHFVDSLDPAIQVEMGNIVDMSEVYLSRILEEAGYSGTKQKRIADKLIFGLPTHEFVIQEDLAKEIGIEVEKSDTDTSEWNMMRRWLDRYITKATDRHFVKYVIPRKKDGG